MAKQKEVKQENISGISFFNSADRNENGRPKSVYPMYFFGALREQMVEELIDDERRLERLERDDIFNSQELAPQKLQIKKSKEKIQEFDKSKPELTGPQKDLLWDFVKSTKDDIRDSMFSSTEMETGRGGPISDIPKEEVRRQYEGIIKIDPKFRGIMEDCDCQVDENGQFSRDSVIRVYKIASATLGENPSTEALRRSGRTDTLKFQETLMEMLGMAGDNTGDGYKTRS